MVSSAVVLNNSNINGEEVECLLAGDIDTNGLVQYFSISSVLAMEILQSCTKLLIHDRSITCLMLPSQ